jgi:2'-5' RNA ligase
MAANDEFKNFYRHGALVIWPPDDVKATVGALRQRYDPASQAICDAHITLSQPFLSMPTADDLAKISDLVACHLPLEIAYGPLGTFLPYPCVYLEIQPAEPLRALQRALYDLELFDLPQSFSDPETFVFHMSITDGYPDEFQTRQIFEALSGSEPIGRFVAGSVAWIRPDSDLYFETVHLFRSVASGEASEGIPSD